MSESWIRAVNAVIRGEAANYRFVRLGPTPTAFQKFGLLPVDLAMSAAKLARVRREHPELSLDVLHRLPELICNPLALFPSVRRDGSVVLVLVLRDLNGEPVIAAVVADPVMRRNVVLSVYGKNQGNDWIKTQIRRARADGFAVFESEDFAASVPKPGSASEDTIPSSSDLIPVDGTAKSKRLILQLRKKST